MLDDLLHIHDWALSTITTDFVRQKYSSINWGAHAISIYGARGVGKTTLMCQYLLEKYKQARHGLYLSADNVHVLSQGLFNIAMEYFNYGGQALFIDEVHKYPDWSLTIKNILDTFKKQQIIFTASSAIDLKKSKGDLSRRVVYHELTGFSFREYLQLNNIIKIDPISLQDIITRHEEITQEFNAITILKHFQNYLQYGFYPFFLEGIENFLSKLNNVIEKVIFEDIAIIYNLRQSTLTILKKLLWLIATSDGLTPNIDRISGGLGASKDVIYRCIEYLDQAGLIKNIYPDAQGMKLIRKPAKIHIENTNLLHAINGSLNFTNNIGNAREIFFVNQVGQQHRVNFHEKGDFIVDGQYIFEVGGKGKSFKQIKNQKNSFLAVDGIKTGLAHKIPLYLFGMLS